MAPGVHVSDDSHRVTIAEAKPVGELRNLSSPESVRYYEEWEWTVEVWNVGNLAGDFRVKLTGDIESESAFTVAPGSSISLRGEGVGPANFQVHLELIGWVRGNIYHHVVGPTATAGSKATRAEGVVASSEVVVEVGESIEGVDFPEAEFRNPNFPSEVGPDETWESTIEAWNSGTRRGWFRARLVGDGNDEYFAPFELRIGRFGLFSLRASGPVKLTWYIYIAEEFTEHDSLAVSVPQRTSPSGELRNLIFPKFGVDPNETWEGNVEAWNVGTTMETFRLNVTGDIPSISESFELAPGQYIVVTFGGTGPTPNGFTTTLQRMEATWVNDDSMVEDATEPSLGGVGEKIRVFTSWVATVNVPQPDGYPHLLTQGAEIYVAAAASEPARHLRPREMEFIELKSSAVEWFPLFVAKDRWYWMDVYAMGYPGHVRGLARTWDPNKPFVGAGYYLRGEFPIA